MPPPNRDVLRGLPPNPRASFGSTTVRTNFYREELRKHWDCLEQQREYYSDFYREELRKHWDCLEQQREYYSEKAIDDVEAALTRLMSQVEQLCARKDGDQLVGRLLRKIDGVSRLSAWSDSKKSH